MTAIHRTLTAAALVAATTGCAVNDPYNDTQPRPVPAPPATKPGPPAATSCEQPTVFRAQQARLTPEQRAALVSAATEFLDSYLPVLYGRGDPEAVRPVSHELQRNLRAHPPIVSRGARALHPVVAALTTYPQTLRSAKVAALIADGGTVNYPLTFDMHVQDGRWVVSTLAD